MEAESLIESGSFDSEKAETLRVSEMAKMH